MSFISQFRLQLRNYIYHPVYKGPLEHKKRNAFISKYPFISNEKNLNKEFENIHEIRKTQLKPEDASPFHLVWRYKKFGGNTWQQKLILRRLGLHQREPKQPVIVPNTPHYNKMLYEVKHLIRLKPLKFPDGIPTENDIGSVKLDMERGEMRINSAYKIPQELLDKSDLPPLFTGKYMREYLKWASGIIGHSLPSLEVNQIDGNHIEDYDRKMKNHYKHQHKFYTK